MGKKKKIVKIEDVKRPESDHVTTRKMGFGYGGYKIPNNNSKHIPLPNSELRYKSTKNYCCICGTDASKVVSCKTNIKGTLQLERYCPSCFDKYVDVKKMVIRETDYPFLQEIKVRPSQGQTIHVEELRKQVKPWEHF